MLTSHLSINYSTMLPLVLGDFMAVINIVYRFNHKPDVRTTLRVILHENLRKFKWGECLHLTRLVQNTYLVCVYKHDKLAFSCFSVTSN